ncbi:MAG TPA: pitrilysin family protein [Gemmatimonadales bacterium]
MTNDHPLWTSGVRRETLPNGLTLLVQPVPGSPAAAMVTRVGAGFFDEPDEWAGISHVLEHMFFKGTPTRGVGAIARATRAAGGYLNAGTGYDHTEYFTVLPVRGLAAAVAIQSDALRNALLDPEELRREIRVIIEEAKRKLDTPSAVAQETLHATLFDRHRIRRWRIGTEEGLSRLTRDDVFAYYRSRYVPGRTIVAMAGGLDPDEALVLAHRHYADWAPGPAVVDWSPSPEEPTRRERRAATLRGDVRQADLVLGWRGVPALDPDALPLDLAATVLGTGRAGWLYRALRDSGLVTSIGAWSFSPTEVGVFGIAAELDASRLAPALEAIAREVDRLREHGPQADDLERARTLLRTGWARRFETAEGRAAELAAAEALESVDLLEREYARLLALTAEDVRDAARRHLDPRAVAGVAYLPRETPEDLNIDVLGDAFDREPPSAVKRSVAIPPVAPKARAAHGDRVGEVLHVPLAGADLLLRVRRGTPTATLGVYRVRSWPEVAEQAGLGALAIRSAVRGAGGYDGPVLAEAFERLGGALRTSVTTDWFGVSTTVLADHLAEAAYLLDLVLRDPRLAPDEVLIERSLLAEDASQAADDMYRRPLQLAYAAAFGHRGYGLPAIGWPETVRTLEPDAVRAWHGSMMAAGRTTVVAVGDFDADEAAGALAGCWGDHPAALLLEAGQAGEGNGRPHVPRRVEEREKAQTALAMVFPGPDRQALDRHAADVWAAWAGGLGGRLFESLRDLRSLAYTVSAYPWQRRTTGALVTYIATSPEREEDARSAMLEELTGFGEREPPADEVAGTVSYLVGQSEVRRQSAGALAGEILDAWLQGTGLEELIDPGVPYRAVRPADVRLVAATYLDPARRSEGVVRGTPSP